MRNCRIGVVLAALSFATRAHAGNWQETAVQDLLKSVDVTISRDGDRVHVNFKNIGDGPIIFRYRFKCLLGPTKKGTAVRGDSPWFTDRVAGVEELSWHRESRGNWEGCRLDSARADNGISIDVQRR
jgi:hypothetical protein